MDAIDNQKRDRQFNWIEKRKLSRDRIFFCAYIIFAKNLFHFVIFKHETTVVQYKNRKPRSIYTYSTRMDNTICFSKILEFRFTNKICTFDKSSSLVIS